MKSTEGPRGGRGFQRILRLSLKRFYVQVGTVCVCGMNFKILPKVKGIPLDLTNYKIWWNIPKCTGPNGGEGRDRSLKRQREKVRYDVFLH